jgi:hypothetical protein
MSEKHLPRADHHEAMKQPGVRTSFERPSEMRISLVFQKENRVCFMASW